MKALVLSGGGARGAYQTGVLLALGDLCSKVKQKTPFKIISGVSAGAINAAFMAAEAEDFSLGVQKLSHMWSKIEADQVFKTDAVSLGKIGLQWMGELSFGGLSGSTPGKALLDTSPLKDLIAGNLDLSKIAQNIERKTLHSLAITALDYKSNNTITFVQGSPHVDMWERSRRKSERATIRPDHIMASSAIPLLFPPIPVDESYFGDGCLRNQAPLSPALHLGATRLFVIGVRKVSETADDQRALLSKGPPSVSRVINVLLNTVMLDSIELDIERLRRINEFMNRVPEEHHANLNFKKVEYTWIHPSEDIGAIAADMSARLPRVIRYLLKGLGPLEDASEIISYLLFDRKFCERLIEIGYEDAMRQADAIVDFLAAPE